MRLAPDVNRENVTPPDHLAYLLHTAMRRLRSEGEAAAPPSIEVLQAAQARLLDLIPPGGGRVTELAAVMRISKQGLGQLVAQLTAGGYVSVSPDPADKRAKLISRTTRGNRLQRSMRTVLAEVEGRWRAEVGPERYAVFRDVLQELTCPPSRQGRQVVRPSSDSQ